MKYIPLTPFKGGFTPEKTLSLIFKIYFPGKYPLGGDYRGVPYILKNRIVPYRKDLKEKARSLRKDSTLSEVLLWQEIRKKQLGVQFHRQVPVLDYIVDFYCHELMLAIEVNGNSHEWKISYDKRRLERIETQGIKVIVFDDLDVKQNMKWVVNSILEKVNLIRQQISPSGDYRGVKQEK